MRLLIDSRADVHHCSGRFGHPCWSEFLAMIGPGNPPIHGVMANSNEGGLDLLQTFGQSGNTRNGDKVYAVMTAMMFGTDAFLEKVMMIEDIEYEFLSTITLDMPKHRKINYGSKNWPDFQREVVSVEMSVSQISCLIDSKKFNPAMPFTQLGKGDNVPDYHFVIGWPLVLRADHPPLNQRLVDMGCPLNDDNMFPIMVMAGPKTRMQLLDLKFDIGKKLRICFCVEFEMWKWDTTGRWKASIEDWNLLQSM